MIYLINLIGYAFVLFLLIIAFSYARDELSFYFNLRQTRRRALDKAAQFLTPKNQLFGNLTLENEFCSLSIKQLQNQIIGMSKVFDSMGQKKVFVAKCTVERIWNADSMFNVIANSFNADIKYEEIRRRVIEYSVMEERVYVKDESRRAVEEKNNKIAFNPRTQNFKKVETIEEKLLGSLIDINTATEEELEKLPGIGSVIAKKIVLFRINVRLFKSVDDFFDSLNIKESVAQKIRGYMCAMNFGEDPVVENTKQDVNTVRVEDNLRELDATLNDEQSSVSSTGVITPYIKSDERVVDFD